MLPTNFVGLRALRRLRYREHGSTRMARRSPSTTEHVDADGVRTIEAPGVRRSVWLLLVAITLVGVAILVVIRPAMQQALTAPAIPSPPEVGTDARERGAAAAPPKVPQQPAPAVAQAPHPPDGAAPPQREAPAAPRARAPGTDTASAANGGQEKGDEPTGLALFPPPGTKPIKRGIVVPDDVELPPGYVRHYQTTDDGRQLPPILMFHPDYQPVDQDGKPIPVPDDRVVPAEMVPPGIPARTLEVPEEGAEVEASGGGRKRPAP
jgi:hypothetical protein